VLGPTPSVIERSARDRGGRLRRMRCRHQALRRDGIRLVKAGRSRREWGDGMTERRVAVYPASFDPITNGHLDLIARASRLFDEVVVAVAVNVDKSGGTFPLDERIRLVREAVAGVPNVRIDVISGLLVDYLRGGSARASCCAGCARSPTSNTSSRWR
jgi:cytidyltransferase-like protein